MALDKERLEHNLEENSYKLKEGTQKNINDKDTCNNLMNMEHQLRCLQN